MDIENKQRLINELINRAVNNKLTLLLKGIHDLADIKKAVSGEVQKGKVLLRV